MEVNGRQVDMLSWLKETGGASAVKRFKTPSTTAAAQTTSSSTADRVTLSREAVAALRTQVQYNSAGALLGQSGVPPSTSGTMNELLQQVNPLNALPPTAAEMVAKNNTVRVNPADVAANAINANGTGNIVDFTGEGRARNNAVTVNGDANYIRAYNGGQQGNAVSVTGSDNRVYAGAGAQGNNVTVKGSGSTVSQGEETAGTAVTIAGNNVTVSFGGNNAAANKNWKVSVTASDVEVNVVNGKAGVNMAQDLKDKYTVTIDNERRTVSVAAVAQGGVA